MMARSPSVALNLLDRQFAAERPNQRWIADFTYIRTAEGWLYVAAVIDLCSRRLRQIIARRLEDIAIAIRRQLRPQNAAGRPWFSDERRNRG
jgi:transposase InsO family protein